MLGNNNDDDDNDDDREEQESPNNECSIIDETRESDIEEASHHFEDDDENEDDDVNDDFMQVIRTKDKDEKEDATITMIDNQYTICSEEDKRKLQSEMRVDYEIAVSRGKERPLWDLSKVNKATFDSVQHPTSEEWMPHEESDFITYFGDNKAELNGACSNDNKYQNDLIMEILKINENDDEMKILIDLFHETSRAAVKNNENVHEEDKKEDENNTNVCVNNEANINTTININANINNTNNTNNTNDDSDDILDRVTLSQFSPRTKNTIHNIKSKIYKTTSIETIHSISSLFPHWEENILYAFRQRSEDCHYALNQVRQKRIHIPLVKEMILRKVNALDSALDLFENVLCKSLSLHQEKEKKVDIC